MTAYEAAQAAFHEAARRVQSEAENRVGELVGHAFPDATVIIVFGDRDEGSEVKVTLEEVIGPGGVVLADGQREDNAAEFDELAEELVEPFGYLTVTDETGWLGGNAITVTRKEA